MQKLLSHWIAWFQKPLVPRRLAVGTFFFILLFVGWKCVHDFGIPFDEGTMDSLGKAAYDRVLLGVPWSYSLEWQYHGPIVEFFTYTVIHALEPIDQSLALLLRHSIVFLFFFAGVWIFYCLAKRFFGDWKIAFLGAAMLVLSPRLFAHGFYNSRDIPNLTLFSLSILTLLRLLDRPTIARVLLHALCCALALSLRVTSIALPVLTIFFLLHNSYFDSEELPRKMLKRMVGILILYLGVMTVLTILFWPLLWDGPVKNFVAAMQHMSSHEGNNFYWGSVSVKNPWHYIPMWIFITTPLLYTLLFVIGCGSFCVQAARSPWNFLKHEPDTLLYLLWFFGPIIAIILTGSGVYQEWRHVLFVYPAFLMLALIGAKKIAQILLRFTKYAQKLIIVGVIILLLPTGVWMVRNRPFEYVYFSIPTSFVYHKFDLDYWGLSYRQAFGYIFEHDKRPSITIHAEQNIGYINGKILFPSERNRWVNVKPEYADYIIESNSPESPSAFSSYPIVHEFTVDGMVIRTIRQGPGAEALLKKSSP